MNEPADHSTALRKGATIDGVAVRGAGRVFAWLEGALWWAMPADLPIMQKAACAPRRGAVLRKHGVPSVPLQLAAGVAS